MLDIGASQGYYSFRAAYNYPNSVFVMIEGNNEYYPLIGSQLLDLCKTNTMLDNIIFLNKALALEDAQRLSECEHFDVVLALNIIHWFPESWKDIADAILNMGSHIIIETPPQELGVNDNKIRRQIEEYLLSKGAYILAKAPRHTSHELSSIYLVETKKCQISRKTWLMPPLRKKSHLVFSDFEKKELHKFSEQDLQSAQITTWVPGINLVTFKMYQGAYPTPDMIKKSLLDICDESHTDWMVNNMILQGKKLRLIDCNDIMKLKEKGWHPRKFSSQTFEKICKLLTIANPAAVQNFFWQRLIKSWPINS